MSQGGAAGRRIGALVLTLAAAVVSLLAAEGLLRVLVPDGPHGPFESAFDWLEADGVLGWRNRPGFRHEGFAIGRHGLVGEPSARPGSLRVLCLGDSRTFGIWLGEKGLRFDGAYPAHLQRLADAAGSPASLTVWNAGTVGYTSAHGLRQWLLRLDEALRPDVLVAAFGFNDHGLAWNRALRVRTPASPLARAVLDGLARSRVVETSLYVWRQRLAERSADTASWLTPEQYEQQLAILVEEARRRGVRPLLLSMPLRSLALGESPPLLPGEGPTPYILYGGKDLADVHRVHARYRERLLALAAREGVSLLDAGPDFEAYRIAHPDREEALFSRYDFVHPNERGGERLAALVLERLGALGWLDARRSAEAAAAGAPALADAGAPRLRAGDR